MAREVHTTACLEGKMLRDELSVLEATNALLLEDVKTKAGTKTATQCDDSTSRHKSGPTLPATAIPPRPERTSKSIMQNTLISLAHPAESVSLKSSFPCIPI